MKHGAAPVYAYAPRSSFFSLYLVAAGASLVTVYLFLTFRIVPVNEDAGTFIPIAKEVMHGAVPTKDVMTWKTPGMYYLAALWMRLFGTAFERVVLLVYIVNVLNGLLLYLVLSRFVAGRMARLILCFSYFYSAMILEGFWVVLEPFQVALILAAYLVYLANTEGLSKYGLTGLLLGCSVMIKQYSAFVLAGFLVAVWLDRRREDGTVATMRKMGVIVLSSVLPFFAFVGLTGADVGTALRSFGALGGTSAAYAAAGWSGPGRLVLEFLAGVVRANWLFLPLLLYLFLFLKDRDFVRPAGGARLSVVPLLISSALPLLVRQFNHYFLLIAPWSYVLLGMMLGRGPDGDGKAGSKNGYMNAAAAVCMAVVLPVFVVSTPSFYSRPKTEIALFTLLFLMSALSLLYAGWRRSGHRPGMHALVLALCAYVFLETLFLGMKLPFRELRLQKEAQFREAEEINAVFGRGTSVYVIGYHPYVYVTCDFVSPLHDYEFNNSAEQSEIQWDRIGSVIAGARSATAYRRYLDAQGFKKIGNRKAGLEFYEKKVKGESLKVKS